MAHTLNWFEIPVAEAKPLPLAELLEPIHDRPRLAADPPAAYLVVEAGQRVGDGVVIRPHGEAVELEVVAGVHDHRQVAPDSSGEALGHLFADAARAAGDDRRAAGEIK